MQELADLMEIAENTSGPARAVLVSRPAQEQNGARGSVDILLPMVTDGNPYGCDGLSEALHEKSILGVRNCSARKWGIRKIFGAKPSGQRPGLPGNQVLSEGGSRMRNTQTGRQGQ